MNILVLNPASRFTKNVVRDVLYGCWCKGKRIGGATVPPFALLQVATVLKRDGNDCVFIDAQAVGMDQDEVTKIAAGFDVVVISTSTMSYKEDMALLTELKRSNPRLKAIAFGSHPTFLPHSALSHSGADIIVRREPEYVIRDLVRALRTAGDSWKSTRGIGYRLNGKHVVNDYYPFIENLDELPFIDVSLLPEGVDYFNPAVKRMPYITTITSRGCPARCTFCTAAAFDGMRVRYQSAGYVLGQIEYFLKNGYREIFFRDDTFLVDKMRDAAICRGIIERGYDLTWICNVRAGMVDKMTLDLIRSAGCHLIKVGVESGVQEILNRAKKGIKVQQTKDTFYWAKDAGIDTHAHVMLGMPGETADTLKRTVDFVLELNPTTATFGICTPYPGAPLFEDVSQISSELKDGTDSDFSRLHTEGLFNEYYTQLKKEQLAKGVRAAYRQFYMRPSYLFNSLKRIRNTDDIKRFAIAGLNIFDFSLRGE